MREGWGGEDEERGPSTQKNVDEGDKLWYFNSSVAEQTNGWLGGYHSICREMLIDKYNFFLDKTMLCRNRVTKEKLLQEGEMPRTWPM